MSFRVALGLPKNASAKVEWIINNQKTIGHHTTIRMDKFLCKMVQLKQSNIKNKIERLYQLSKKNGEEKYTFCNK